MGESVLATVLEGMRIFQVVLEFRFGVLLLFLLCMIVECIAFVCWSIHSVVVERWLGALM